MPQHFADQSITPASISAVDGINVKEGMQRALVNDAMRAITAMVKADFAANAGTITASSTFTLASISTGDYVLMAPPSGLSITSFGANTAGIHKWLEATGAMTLRHSANLDLPGNADLTLAAGDILWTRGMGGTAWKVAVIKDDGKPITPSTNGKHKLWIPAAAMTAHPSVPPAFATILGTDIPYNTWDFDQTNLEAVFFNISMPSSWDEGTVTFVPVWTAASSSGGVAWSFQAVARSNDDAIAGSPSTTVTSIDTLLSTGDLHRGPETSALTIDATPASNDTIFFLAFRAPSNGSDTIAADCRLLGIELYLTTNEAVDVAT